MLAEANVAHITFDVSGLKKGNYNVEPLSIKVVGVEDKSIDVEANPGLVLRANSIILLF